MSEDTRGFFKGRILGVDHITVPVRDMAVAERFYVDLLGAEVISRTSLASMQEAIDRGDSGAARRVHTCVRLGSGPQICLFLQGHGQPKVRQDHPHIALMVSSEDLLPMKEALRARGIPTDGPRRLGPPGSASLYFNDPFGNHLELCSRDFTGEAAHGPPDNESYAYDVWKG